MRPGAGSEATGKSALDILARFRRALRFSFTRVGRRLFFKAIGNFAVLWQEIEARAPGLHLEERREIHVAQLEADHVGHDLVHQRRHRHWNLELARGFEPELEILSQQLAREGWREIEVDERRCFVAGEGRAHHAAVEKLEVVGPRDPATLCQHCGLVYNLTDDTENQVVTDLDQPRTLAFSDIAHSRAEHLEVRVRHFKSLARAGNSDAEAAGAHNLWIAADRSGEKGGAELFRFRADLLGHLYGNCRRVDDHSWDRAAV